jgi:hypothetical protein
LISNSKYEWAGLTRLGLRIWSGYRGIEREHKRAGH